MVGALKHIFDKTKEPCRGIIHVGGHWGQEIEFYLNNLTKNVVVYEPLNQNFATLANRWRYSVDCRKKAVGSFNGEIELNVESANAGQSSSVLKPKKHLEQYPDITFDSKESCEIVKLDDDIERHADFDTLVVDVQGYELEVFKGAANLLSNSIEHIVCEVNCAEMYEGCALVGDLDSYLIQFGFKRILTIWEGGDWGNALYEKF